MATIKAGSSGNVAEVNKEGKLQVEAVVEPEIEHASEEHGLAFSFDSGERDIDAGDTMLFVKNTGSANMILSSLTLNGSNVICQWEVRIGNATTTPVATGGTVAGTNLNRNFAAKAAPAQAIWDESAVANGDIVDRHFTPITDTHHVDLRGLVLGQNHYIQINQVTESTSGSAILFGHFDPEADG